MATKIYHGVPGSYKSSSALWFDVLPALRNGRVVVTNLQGLLSLNELEVALNEVFPPSAKLLRISTSTDNGLLLIRNFFHWLPIGAMLFIDEIQDVYPNDRSFKASDFDYKEEGFFDHLLPAEFVKIYHEVQLDLKNNVNVDDYLDDLGESLFDERFYLRYPRTLRECMMRHRHYNWDILLATPDIKEVTPFVRSITEVAYAHTSKDAIPLSYYKRRPRLLEHNPKLNGITIGKADAITYRKIPLDVFKLYKSTATGTTTKSGVGSSPFTRSFKIAMVLVFAYIIFMVWFFVYKTDSTTVPGDEVKSSEVSKNKVFPQKDKKNVPVSDEVIKKGSDAVIDFSFDNDLLPLRNENAISLKELPFNTKEIYISGIQTKYYSKYHVTRDYIFTLLTHDNKKLAVNSDLFIALDYKIFYKTDCLIEMRSPKSSFLVMCDYSKMDHVDESETDNSFEVSLL